MGAWDYKMAPLRVVTCVRLLLTLLILDAVTSDIREFFSNLPSDFGNSINNAWKNIIRAIKRPVRIRRLGRTGKTKSTRAMMITTDIVFILNINTLNSTVPESETTTTKTHKLVIPFLATPKWKTMMDWRRLRQDTGIADEINKRKLVPGPHHYASYEKTPVNKISSADEIKNFGNLFFV